MGELAADLEQAAGRRIVDETGLTGTYDFRLRYESARRGPDTGATADPPPNVFTAVEDQLGLKLEKSTHTFAQFVIESIDREPTEN
jgi:uncharacterized protein (TIGR03435 family)